MKKNNSQNSIHESRHDYHQQQKKHWFGRIIRWILLIIFLLIVSGVGLFAFYAKDAPNISKEQLQSGGTSSIYTNDGKFLFSLGSEKRIYVKDSHKLDLLKDAVVSIEDKRFYDDKLGIDPIRIVGSMLSNAKSNSIAAGGSTITQQLVKLSVFSTSSSQRTLKRKSQEAWLAMKVQHEYSHNQILEYYINKVYMNYGNYGIGTAANYYYNKPINKLDLAQTALLAGMPNSPINYDPYVYPKKAKYRRNLVLKAMLDNGKITKKRYKKAAKENIKHGLQKKQKYNESKLRKIDDPYIKETISEVKSRGFNPYNDNLKITINIDQDAQNKLYELANNNVVPFSNDKMQVGASVVDPNNGHVVAILGGRHLPSVQLGLNRSVQTSRSSGSSIKPILDYGPAIEYLNWSTAKTIDDSKYVYPGTNIQLHDWDNKYDGVMNIRHALEQSRNVPAVKTLKKVGINRAALFARNLGIDIPANSGLSTAIGANASSLQMAGAYGAFATMGVYHKPQFVSKIETPDGAVRKYDSPGKTVMKKSTAYMITDMLKGVIKRGSGTNAQIHGLHQAGKTGTVKYADEDLVKYPSYNSTPKDSWFVGYTRSYVIGVWTGYDNLRDGTITGVGAQSAQLMYKNMMTYLMRQKPNLDWKKPDSVIRAKIAQNSNPPRLSNSGQWQLFVSDHAPAGIVDQSEEYNSASKRNDVNRADTSSENSQNTTDKNRNKQNGKHTQEKKQIKKPKPSSKDKSAKPQQKPKPSQNTPNKKPDKNPAQNNKNSRNHSTNDKDSD